MQFGLRSLPWVFLATKNEKGLGFYLSFPVFDDDPRRILTCDQWIKSIQSVDSNSFYYLLNNSISKGESVVIAEFTVPDESHFVRDSRCKITQKLHKIYARCCWTSFVG